MGAEKAAQTAAVMMAQPAGSMTVSTQPGSEPTEVTVARPSTDLKAASQVAMVGLPAQQVAAHEA